jgi:hypothetical protein
MFKLILTALIISGTIQAYAQGSDLLILKKKNGRTLQTFLNGSYFHFIDISGHENAGIIRKIDKDSVFVQFHDIRMRYTMWGTSVSDTVSSFLNAYHYRQIAAVMKPPRGFGFIRNGSLFIIGGTGYAALHLANAAINKEPVDPVVLAVAGAVTAGGLLLKKIRKESYLLGKKFYFNYIDM